MIIKWPTRNYSNGPFFNALRIQNTENSKNTKNSKNWLFCSSLFINPLFGNIPHLGIYATEMPETNLRNL